MGNPSNNPKNLKPHTRSPKRLKSIKLEGTMSNRIKTLKDYPGLTEFPEEVKFESWPISH